MNGKDIVYRTIVIRGTSEGLDKLQADLNKVAAAHKGVTVATEETEKSSSSLEKALQRQKLRLDEVARAQNNIERETKLANKGVQAGLHDQQEATRLIELANQRYGTASKATQEFGKQTGLARHELINLGRQAQDVGVSLVSGQSPLMVLAQQGSQIADVFISSGKSVGDFFKQAIGWAAAFAKTPLGIVAGITAIGAAAAYAAYQFLKSSTTIEEALEKQKSLMDATKTSIGELIDAQIKLQSVETARFEGLRNQEDLQQKLIKSAGYLAEVSVRRTTSPLQDIGAALGIGPAADPSGGYEKIAAAVERLKAVAASARPDVVGFRNEVAGIGEAARTSDPGVATFAEKILKLSLEALNLETSLLKARAALQSVAQSNLNNLGAKEAAEATERLAVAATNILNTYPGITVETAKTLANLTSQMTTQDKNNVMLQLEGKFRSINATYVEKINQLLRDGLILTTAVADAEQNRQAAIKAAIKDATDLNRTVDQGSKKAIQDFNLRLAMGDEAADRQNAQHGRLYDSEGKLIDLQGKRANETERIYRGEAAVGDALEHNSEIMYKIVDRTRSAAWWAETMAEKIGDAMNLLDAQFEKGQQFVSTYDPLNLTRQKASLEKLYGAENVEAVTTGIGLSAKTSYRVKSDYVLNSVLAAPTETKLTNSLDNLKDSTDSLNATMQDALSPFYSMDPRTTKLGFRAGTVGNPDWLTGAGNENAIDSLLGKGATAPGMANGGSFVVGGGYSANDNKIAMFPVASGEQVVVNRNRQQGSGAQVVNIDNRIIIQGTVGDDALAKLKVSRYQQAQRMRAGIARA